MTDLRAAVVVVNWNGADVLGPCLASLRGALAAGTEVVVVDNASTDGSPDLVPDVLPGATLVRRDRNDGFAAGVNAGVAATSADVILLLNNDAVASPGWVAAMVAPFVAEQADDADGAAGATRLGAVTGRVLLADALAPAPQDAAPATALRDHAGRPWVRVAADAPGARRLVNSTGNEVTRSGNGRDRGWLTPADGPPADPEVFGFNGGCAALRRTALDDIGGLDESLFMYYEDTDASWRLRRRGWRVEHAPDAVTEHRHAASSGTASEFFAVHNVRNRLVVALRHAPWPVVVRAYGRTAVRAVLGPHRGWWLRALGGALRRLPADLRTRRAVDRSARVPRRDVARLLVADG